MSKETVAIGLSGGVDSAVAAALLLEAGYQLIGVTMRIWDDSYKFSDTLPAGNACFGPDEGEDIEDARQVARHLDIPFHLVDLRQQYQEIVLDYFKREYRRGRTPNPCIRCNYHLKFNAILQALSNQGVHWDYFATGHYVRQRRHNQQYSLLRGKDKNKDQSYFLYTLDQKRLSRTLFPLGELTKPEVREYARKLNLPVRNKDESQDFYAGDYTELLDGGSGPGPIVDSSGRELGQHRGIENYTIGQRRGLGLAVGKPLYVKRIDAAENRIVVAEKQELFSAKMTVEQLNWLTPIDAVPDQFEVKIRYRHRAAPARVLKLGEELKLQFVEPQLSVTPGQAAVFYHDELVLGGGIINC